MAGEKEYIKLSVVWLISMFLDYCLENLIECIECYTIFIQIFVQYEKVILTKVFYVQKLAHFISLCFVFVYCREVGIELSNLLSVWVNRPDC